MFKPSLNDVVSHWSQPYSNFSTSALDFYDALVLAINRCNAPGLEASRVEYRERGALSPKRVYLRLRRERLLFDICAAPFGDSYFFSWWLAERRIPPILALILVVLQSTIAFIVMQKSMAAILSQRDAIMFYYQYQPVLWVIYGLIWFGLFYLLGRLTAKVFATTINDVMCAVPIVGIVYQWLFKPDTYYRLDTAAMFQSVVHSAVIEVVNDLTAPHGRRQLNADEDKPIMRDILARRIGG